MTIVSDTPPSAAMAGPVVASATAGTALGAPFTGAEGTETGVVGGRVAGAAVLFATSD